MYAEQTTLKNATGLHARPASDFVACAKSFSSQVFLRNVNKPEALAVNAKSIVRVLAEGISSGTLIEVSANGTDEQEAVSQLIKLINQGFGEE